MIKTIFCTAVLLVCAAPRAQSPQTDQDPKTGRAADLRPKVLALPSGEELTIDAGTITVPENRANADSRAIEIGFIRVPYPADDAGPPVLFISGGPGGSSISQVEQFVQRGGKRLLELFGGDLVGVDLRGVGRSGPDLLRSKPIPRDPSVPGDPGIELAAIRAATAEFVVELQAEGIDLAGYHTRAAADDIEAVRLALGYDKISLWGTSYGSHLALSVLRRHEAHIARVVLVGPEGPNHTIKTPSQIDAGLDALARAVANDPEWSQRIPNLRALVATALQPFRAGPVAIEVDGQTVGISLWDAQTQIALSMGLVRGNMDLLPVQLEALAAGNHAELARAVLEGRRSHSTGPAVTMLFDSASGLTNARAVRIAREAKDALLGDVINFPFPHVREAWGAPDLGADFRAPISSDVPVLIIVGDLDCKTPRTNAEEILKGLPNGVLFTVRHAAHDVNWMQSGLREAWATFLRGEDVTSQDFDAPPIRFAPPR